MSGARVVKGWCPVHDRVVKASDGLCPDCGTPLVTLPGKRPGPKRVIVEDEPAPQPGVSQTTDDPPIEPPKGVELGPAALAAIVTGIVLIAFFSGISVSRNRPKPAANTPIPQSRQDYAVRGSRDGAGVSLKLDSFTQRGRRVVIRVSVPPNQTISSGRIGRAEIELLVAGGSRNAIVELPTRSTVTGFIIDGDVLERPDVPVYGMKINSITLTDVAGKMIPVDVSGVWKPSVTRPRAVAMNESARIGFRTFKLAGLVGWSDRIEARFELGGERPGWRFDDAFSLIIGGQSTLHGTIVPSDRQGVLHVVFEGPGEGRSDGVILVRHENLTIVGDWLWVFTPDPIGRR